MELWKNLPTLAVTSAVFYNDSIEEGIAMMREMVELHINAIREGGDKEIKTYWITKTSNDIKEKTTPVIE